MVGFVTVVLFVTENKVLFLRPDQEKDKTYFTDKESGVELELVDSMALLEWFANNYKSFGKPRMRTIKYLLAMNNVEYAIHVA